MLVLTKSIALWLLNCLFISLYDVNNSKVNFVFLKNVCFYVPRLLSKHFCLQPFFPKDSVHGGHWKESFWDLGHQIAGKCISDTLSDCRSIACTSLINIFFQDYHGLLIMYTKLHNTRWSICHRISEEWKLFVHHE